MSNQTHSISRTSQAARVAGVLGALVLMVLIAAPWWAGRADMRLMGELFLYLALASLWNLMAGYAGLVSVGQQAYVGFGGYMLFALTIFGGLQPLYAIAGAGVLGAHVVRADDLWRLAPFIRDCRGRGSWGFDRNPSCHADLSFARSLFCDRYVGDCRSVSIVLRTNIRTRRRLRIVAACWHCALACEFQIRARKLGLLDGSWRCSDRNHSCLFAAALAQRPRVDGHSRQ